MKLPILLFFVMLVGGAFAWVGWNTDTDYMVGASSNIWKDGAFNMTGDGKWIFMQGAGDGTFSGYYWNGSSWISNSSLVTGLGDVGSNSVPALAFNLTGDGNWTLISGEQDGVFNGYYWNATGATWVSDSSRASGLGDVGNLGTPRMAYNLTGDGNWTLISGEWFGAFYGFYWNGTGWTSDSNRVAGLGDTGWQTVPAIGYDLGGGDGKWTLITGDLYGGYSGFYWNGTGWTSDSNRVNGLPLSTAPSATYTRPAMIYNFTGDGKWAMLDMLGYYYTADWWSTEMPTIRDVAIAPSVVTPFTGGLNCSFVISGARTDPDLWPATVTWYKNTIQNTTWDTSVTCHNATTCYTNVSVPSSALAVGDRWICHVTSTSTYNGTTTLSKYNFSDYQTQTQFNTSSSVENIVFSGAGTQTKYVNLPNVSKVFSGAMSLTGPSTTWVENVSRAGITARNSDHPAIGFNVTGDGNWTLINGNFDGAFYGWYWNGTGFATDNTRVSGLSDVGSNSNPALGFNVTGDGKWTLIVGENGGYWYGYYWNGTGWTSDATRVAGLVNQSQYRPAPSLGFNVTGDGRWALIAGADLGSFYGFYWNGTGWTADNNRVLGTTDIGYASSPSLTLFEDGRWALIAGSNEGYFYGFYWNGTQWISQHSYVEGLKEYTAIAPQIHPALAFNVTGDNTWTVLAGYHLSGTGWYSFSGFNHATPRPLLSPTLDVGGDDVDEWTYAGYLITTETTTNLTTGLQTYLSSCGTAVCPVPITFTSPTAGNMSADISDTLEYSSGLEVTAGGIAIDAATLDSFDSALRLVVDVSHFNGDNCTFGFSSAIIVSNVADIDIPDTSTQSGYVTCYTNDGFNYSTYISFDFPLQPPTQQHTSSTSNLTAQFVYRSVVLNQYGNITYYNITESFGGGTLVGGVTYRTGSGNTTQEFVWYSDWLTEAETTYDKHQNATATSNLTTQFAYNQTQLSVTETSGWDWLNIDITGSCEQNTTSLNISASSSGVRNTNCSHNYYSGDWLTESTSFNSEHQNTTATSTPATQYLYNQTQLSVSEGLGVNWVGVLPTPTCDKNTTAMSILASSSGVTANTNCTWNGFSGDWLTNTEYYYSGPFQNTTATSTLTTQYLQNQTQIDVTDTRNLAWVNINIAGNCEHNTTAMNISALGTVNNNNCSWAGYSGDWITTQVTDLTQYQNASKASTLSSQWAVINDNLNITEGLGLNWTGINILASCSVTTVTDLNASQELAISPCNSGEVNSDWLVDTIVFNSEHQNTTATSTPATQYLYNQTQLNVAEIRGINWTNIDITGVCDKNNTAINVSFGATGVSSNTNCTWNGFSGDYLTETETTYSKNQNATATSNLTTQFAYNQTQLNVTEASGRSWVGINIAGNCEQNTTAMDFFPYGNVLDTNCSHNYYDGDWLAEYTEVGEIAQNATATSNLTTQYLQNNTDLYINETLGVNWIGVENTAVCDVNTTTIPSITASASGVKYTTGCQALGYSSDWLADTISAFTQDIGSITYVHGVAYIKKTVGIINSAPINFTNIDASVMNTKPTWTCDGTTLNITTAGYTTPWRCQKLAVITNVSAEENHSQNVALQDYILPTDTDLYITADVVVNNTDEAVSFSNVIYLNGFMTKTFNIANGTSELIHPAGTNSLAITKTDKPSTGCTTWEKNVHEYKYSETFPSTVYSPRFSFDKGSDWSAYRVFVCNRTDDNCDYSLSCQNSEWEEVGYGVSGNTLLHSGTLPYETLSALQYAVSYTVSSGGGGGGGGGGGTVISCPAGQYWDRLTQTCISGTLEITPPEVSGDAFQGETKTVIMTFKNVGTLRTAVRLSPSISGVLVTPMDFELEPGAEKQVEVRANIPVTATIFQEGIDVYQDAVYALTLPIDFSVTQAKGSEALVASLTGISSADILRISGFLTADGLNIGIKNGAFLVVLLLMVAIYEWSRKQRTIAYAAGTLAVLIVLFVGAGLV